MVESGLRHIHILEDVGYNEIKISLKASDPLMMIEAYRMLAEQVEYPFHLGVTEAGTPCDRHDQIRRRFGHPARRGYRRHDSRFAGRRSGGRSARR